MGFFFTEKTHTEAYTDIKYKVRRGSCPGRVPWEMGFFTPRVLRNEQIRNEGLEVEVPIGDRPLPE